MNKKKAIAAAGVAAALGTTGAIQANAQGEGPAPEKPPVVQTMELIDCPITGKKIPPCCCPEINEED